jgi:hypothetical protein
LLPLVAETLFFEKRGSFLAQQRYKKPYGKGRRQGMGVGASTSFKLVQQRQRNSP